MVMIIDAAKVVARDFESVGKVIKQTIAAQSNLAGSKVAETQDDEIQLVSFEVDGQEYALPIDQVQEIVQIPDHITAIPNAPSHVLGVMTLRNRLLPLVSLREMFGLPSQGISESNKIVVVSLGKGDEAFSVGVMMDSVKEVLRVQRSLIDPMPQLLSRSQDLGEIESICRLNGGKRLVSVLVTSKLFDLRDLQTLVAGGEEESEEMGDGSEAGRTGAIDDEEQFVVFQLQGEEYGVPIGSVQEIVRVPDELTRVPKTPDFVEGVVNLRGVVLPVIDQRRRFGLPSMERSDRQRIMVYTIRGVLTGFIVDQVLEVMRIPASVIGAAPVLSDEQQRLIRRVANIEKQKRMVLLLDVDHLLDRKELSAVGKALH
jgi:purine-binding chemotaxis protein CheW